MKMTVNPKKPGEIKVRKPQLKHLLGKDVAALAYAIYELEGRPEGKDLDHWLTAERMIREDSEGD